jgi:hypothetical protein
MGLDIRAIRSCTDGGRQRTGGSADTNPAAWNSGFRLQSSDDRNDGEMCRLRWNVCSQDSRPVG